MANTIKFPFGPADVKLMTASGTQSFEITSDFTVVDGITTQATGARTLSLSAATGQVIPTGASLLVEHYGTGATSTLTFSTLISGSTYAGSLSGKTNTQLFVFDGTAFVQCGAVVSL